MNLVRRCLCCESERFQIHPAVVAPFLAHYAVERSAFPCELLQCMDCGLRFFDSRLTTNEVARLYSGYRGSRYFEVRHRYEPWYSRKVNDGIGADPDEIVRRHAVLLDMLKHKFDPGSFRNVLDFGGDRGQFIPAELGGHKFVYELSDAIPEPGVIRLGREEIRGRKFDFLMCCGVLEHCSYPAEVVDELIALASPGAVFYISVPYERYDVSAARDTPSYRAYLKFLLKFEWLLILVDFYSTLGRFRWNRIPPRGLLKCHEHLNFFERTSMTRLLERAGVEVLASEIVNVAQYPAKNQSLIVLARRRA